MIVFYQNFGTLISSPNFEADFYIDKNVLIGTVCSDSDSAHMVVQVSKGGQRKEFRPVLTQEGEAFRTQAKFLFKRCADKFSKLHYFNSRIPQNFLSQAEWKFISHPIQPMKLSHANAKTFGIFYHTLHCQVSRDKGEHKIFDIFKIRSEQLNWGPILWPHWVGQPFDDYYCLTGNRSLISKHAVLLKNAGVDYIYIGMTNWPKAYDASGEMLADFKQKFHDPIMSIIDVYQELEGQGIAVPKIALWIGATSRNRGAVVSYHTSVSRWVNQVYSPRARNLELKDSSGMPLLFVRTSNEQNYTWPEVANMVRTNQQNYKLIPMWADIEHFHQQDPTAWRGLDIDSVWSFFEPCRTDQENRILPGCGQRFAANANQISVTSAYQWDYMLHPKSQPKRRGNTFYQQFKQAYRRDIKFVSITGWNEWVAKRHCFGRFRYGNAPGTLPQDEIAPYRNIRCDLENTRAFEVVDGISQPMFVDAYTYEFSRDLEPNRKHSDCYYQLMRLSILAAKNGEADLGPPEKHALERICGFELN